MINIIEMDHSLQPVFSPFHDVLLAFFRWLKYYNNALLAHIS